MVSIRISQAVTTTGERASNTSNAAPGARMNAAAQMNAPSTPRMVSAIRVTRFSRVRPQCTLRQNVPSRLGRVTLAVEYRSARAEEMRGFFYNDSLGFGSSTADADIDRLMAMDWLTPEQTLCAFDDGAAVSQMGVLPFTMRWNGRDIGCGGVTAVSTHPTHRRQGHLRQMMTLAFQQMRESGQPVAMLWASMAAIYQRFGYGIASTQYRSDFDPRTLRFVDDIPVPGRTRFVPSKDAYPLLAGCYERFAEPRTLCLVRDERRWRNSVLRPWPPERPPVLVIVYEEADSLLGYAVLMVEQRPSDDPGPSQRIRAHLTWLTPAAHRALIRTLAGYDLASSILLYWVPEDDPLFHHAQEPRLLNLRAWDGTLVRIVDLVAALEGRGYDADGRLTFAVPDGLCPWNSGTWRLTAEGGCGRVQRVNTPPEITLDPRALAVVASGHRPPSVLARAGLVQVHEPATLPGADALFRTAYAPLCQDGF